MIIPELKVLNYKESLKFYIELAGFDILYERKESEFAMMQSNGAQLMIEGLTGMSRTWETGPLEKPFGRGMHLEIEVLDVQNRYEVFKKAEWPIFFGMEEKWYRINEGEKGNKQFLVQDPDGYLLRFFENMGTRQFIAEDDSQI